jgi:hypothetical protein
MDKACFGYRLRAEREGTHRELQTTILPLPGAGEFVKHQHFAG